ncbi:unnamed protein product, partial [Ectocarpus fasciculatus]
MTPFRASTRFQPPLKRARGEHPRAVVEEGCTPLARFASAPTKTAREVSQRGVISPSLTLTDTRVFLDLGLAGSALSIHLVRGQGREHRRQPRAVKDTPRLHRCAGGAGPATSKGGRLGPREAATTDRLGTQSSPCGAANSPNIPLPATFFTPLYGP